jgi:hypothetical protein
MVDSRVLGLSLVNQTLILAELRDIVLYMDGVGWPNGAQGDGCL